MKRFLISAAITIIPSLIQADTLQVKINGMVCAFCAQGIEKKLHAEEGVKEVKVDLDTKIVDIQLTEGKSLKPDLIKQIITDAGYELVEIKNRTSEKVADGNKM